MASNPLRLRPKQHYDRKIIMYLLNVMTGTLTLFGQKLTQCGVKEQINLSSCVLNILRYRYKSHMST